MDHTPSAPGCAGRCADTAAFALAMAFQPVVDVNARRIYGYEALVRGSRGEPAAEVLASVTSDQIYAFDQACRVKAIESAARLGLDRRLSINFLPRAVYSPEACLRLTLQTAEACRFPTDLITFEFTENEHIVDRPHLRGIVETYRRHGFLTALDDFGAGYSGLSRLADFQPDIIKLDRLLIADIHASRPRQVIVDGVLATARALGIAVVAEGVERPEELAALRSLGIELCQGFLFARPALERLVREAEIVWP